MGASGHTYNSCLSFLVHQSSQHLSAAIRWVPGLGSSEVHLGRAPLLSWDWDLLLRTSPAVFGKEEADVCVCVCMCLCVAVGTCVGAHVHMCVWGVYTRCSSMYSLSPAFFFSVPSASPFEQRSSQVEIPYSTATNLWGLQPFHCHRPCPILSPEPRASWSPS